METKTFKRSGSQRLWLAIFSILPLLFILGNPIYNQLSVFIKSPLQSLQVMSSADLGLLASTFLAWLFILTFWFYPYWLVRQQRLTVSASGLAFNRSKAFLSGLLANSLNGWYPDKTIPFADVTAITTSAWWDWSYWVLHTSKHGNFSVHVNDFYNAHELSELILSRANHAKIDLKARHFTRRNRWNRAYRLAFSVYVVFAFSLNPIVMGLKSTIWHEEFGASHIEAYSLDADGTVWTIISRGYADDFEQMVWKQGQDGWNIWKVPSAQCNGCYSLQAGHDQAGNPYVVNAGDEYVVVQGWDGSTWQEWQVDGDFTQGLSGNFGYDGVIWGHTDTALLRLDFSSKTPQKFDLPSDALAKGRKISWLRADLDDTVGVITRDEQKDEHFYLFRDGQWQGNVAMKDSKYRTAACPGRENDLWVVLESDKEAPGTFQLGHYDFATQIWQSYGMTGSTENPVDGYLCQAVDARGRIWLSGISNVKNDLREFTQVVKVDNGRVVPVLEYTENNANVAGRSLVLAKNERIWAYNRDSLAWIDTSAETLPQPLPAWASWSNTSSFMTMLPILGLPVLGVILLFIWLLQKLVENRST